jgi:hypothetical protein
MALATASITAMMSVQLLIWQHMSDQLAEQAPARPSTISSAAGMHTLCNKYKALLRYLICLGTYFATGGKPSMLKSVPTAVVLLLTQAGFVQRQELGMSFTSRFDECSMF